MRILIVNKFHWFKGGSEKYYFELGQLLKEHGHDIAFFSMKDEKNIQTGEKEYFVKASDMNSKNILKAFQVVSSKSNQRKMEEVLNDFKPDIVHLNNFQRQLSASIIEPCVKRNIPIVYTAHDVQAICPAITMMDSNKNPCELCLKGKYIHCFKKKCIKDSKLKSLLGAVEGVYYRNHKIYTEKMDYIITPSEFYKKKFTEDGVNENKIKTMYNFIEINDYNLKTQDDGYALYFGRLSREKGILNLITAFSQMDKGMLYIAGEGPEKIVIEKMIKEYRLEKRVKLLGFLNKDQMIDVIRKCKFVVVPSIWYENCPYSILETLAIGKPVIGSDMGGIPELIQDGENGFIYSHNHIEELSDKMLQLFRNEELVQKFSQKSKKIAIEKFSKEKYYENIINIYNEVSRKV